MFGMKDLKDLKDIRKQLKDIDKDDLLELVGLQTRSTAAEAMVPVLAAFGVGVLVGAGVGLLLAPKSGREIRDDLRNRIQGASDQVSNAISSASGTMVEKPTTARPL